MKLILDECLPYGLALQLCVEGHVALHPRINGGLQASDASVLARCVAEDLVIVTHNAVDFRRLVGAVELHPGLVILEAADRGTTDRMMRAVLDFIGTTKGADRDVDYMVNRVVEVDATLTVSTYLLPPPA